MQLDLLLGEHSADRVSLGTLIKRLVDERAVPNDDRAQDLIFQAANQGILVVDTEQGTVMPNVSNAIVEKTRLIRDRIVHRVANTLHVRGWEYVNYGFLLKGIGMDHGLVGSGLNTTDAWRSEWVDTLVREGILSRELVPHRHNPEDLVPVIKLIDTEKPVGVPQLPGVTREDVEQMIRRIIVVEQFTSFRGFAWARWVACTAGCAPSTPARPSSRRSKNCWSAARWKSTSTKNRKANSPRRASRWSRSRPSCSACWKSATPSCAPCSTLRAAIASAATRSATTPT